MELWLKTYSKIFVDFENFGNLNWIIIPLFIYFLVTIRKRKRQEKAIVFVLFVSWLLLPRPFHGYTRYIFTLYPFTLAVIFLSGWEFIKKKNHYLQICIFFICGIGVCFNYYHFNETYKRWWGNRVNHADNFFPYETINFIDDIRDIGSDSAILECYGRHLFYYYTNKKTIDLYRDMRIRMDFFSKRINKEKFIDILKNKYKIKYILIKDKTIHFILYKIINYDCDLVHRDKVGYYLYRLHDKKLDKKDLEKIFINNSLLSNGSFENWSHEPLKKPDYFEGYFNRSFGIPEGSVLIEEKEVRVGSYSVKITGDRYLFFQNLSNFEEYKGKKLTLFAWLKTDVPQKYRMQIYDGIGSGVSKYHSGRGEWELLRAKQSINPQAEYISVRVIQTGKTGQVGDVVYVDGALLVEGDWDSFYSYKLHTKKNILDTIKIVGTLGISGR